MNPVVTIIVPARNEEANLAACLESLGTQTGIAYEIIVVDDDSTDRTAENARSFDNVNVIPAGPLPANWTGKNNAMSAGAKVAKGNWLLFTDADTVHAPGSLGRAVAEADEHGAALLSYSPAQEVHGFREKAVMPKRSGRNIFFRYAPDAVCTRMYRSFAQLREGWTKNLALLFPKPVELAQRRLGEFVVLLVVPLMFVRGTYWTTFSSGLHPAWFKWYVPAMEGFTVVAFILCAADFLRRMRRAHFSSWSIVWAFFGLPIFAYLLRRSERAYNKSRFDWKDRTYVYTPEEVEALTAARSSLEPPSGWRRLKGWISNIGRT